MRPLAMFAAFFAIGTAEAGLMNPISYSAPNGGTGYFTYFDDGYTGYGNNTAAYEYLWGGVGQLTDGQMSNEIWFQNPGGWVGWLQSPSDNGGGSCVQGTQGCHPALGAAPQLAFYFGNYIEFEMVRLHLDDADGFGAVQAPRSVRIGDGYNSFEFLVQPQLGPSFYDFDLTGLGLRNAVLFVELNYRDRWIFIDEAQVFGALAPVPEPSTIGVVAVGLACLLLRRKVS